MSAFLNIVIQDRASERLQRLLRLAPSKGLMSAMGKALEAKLRSHFQEKNDKGNNRGWKRSNFWSKKVRNKTSLTYFSENMARVTVASKEFGIHLHGGVIKPIEKEALAVPITSAAKGVWPSQNKFEGLQLIKFEGGNAYLGKYSGSGKQRKLKLYYILLKSVTIPKDPTALPPREQIEESIAEAGEAYIRRNSK